MAQHRTILPEEPPSPDEIRDHLARAGMSQLAFAAWCGSTPQAVRKWLTDRENSSHRDPPRMLWFALWAAVAAADEGYKGRTDPATRIDGYYWAREHRHQAMMIVRFKDGEYTFEGESWETDEGQLIDVFGPLVPPPIEDAGKWRASYDEEVTRRLREGDAPEIAGGWDYLWGYYWGRKNGSEELDLFWYEQGWGPVAREEEFDEDNDTLEIVSGPLTPPEGDWRPD